MSMRCMSTFRAKGLKSKEALPCVLFHRRPKKLAKAVTAKGGRTDGGNLPTSNGIPATMTVRHGTANIASPHVRTPSPTFAPEWSPRPSKECVLEWRQLLGLLSKVPPTL